MSQTRFTVGQSAVDTITVKSGTGGVTGGDVVSLYNDAGILKVKRAQANSPLTPADGFVSQTCVEGGDVDFHRMGENSRLSGLVLNTEYFLSPSIAGGISPIPALITGHIRQSVGKAVSATTLHFDKGIVITLL